MTPFIALVACLCAVIIALPRRPLLVLGVVLLFPLFIAVSEHGLAFANSVFHPQPGVVIPFSVFAAPIAVAWARPWERLTLTSTDRAVLALFIWYLCVGFLGLLTGGLRPLVLLQVVGPMVYYAVGRSAGRETRRRDDLVLGLFWVATATSVWLIVSSLALGPVPEYPDRLGDRLLGGLALWQAYDYVPVVLAVAAAAGLIIAIARQQARYVAGSLCIATVVLTLYARIGVLSLVASAICVGALHRDAITRRLRVALLLATLLGVALAFAVGVTAITRLGDAFKAGGGKSAPSNTTRLTAMTSAGRLVLQNPIVGTQFGATEVDSRTGIAQTIDAHNQFLDLAVRAGIPAVLLFCWVLWAALAQLLRARGSPSAELAVVVVLVLGLVSNMVQVNFGQPLTASVAWTVIGFGLTSSRCRQTDGCKTLKSDISDDLSISYNGRSESASIM